MIPAVPIDGEIAGGAHEKRVAVSHFVRSAVFVEPQQRLLDQVFGLLAGAAMATQKAAQAPFDASIVGDEPLHAGKMAWRAERRQVKTGGPLVNWRRMGIMEGWCVYPRLACPARDP